MNIKVKNILKDKNLYLFLVIVLLFFGLFFKQNFSVDTYQLFATKNMSYMNIYKEDGRLIQFTLINLFLLLRLTPNSIYIVIFILAILFETLSIYFLNNTLKKYITNSFICSLISILIIINPFSIELWLFTEMAVMQLSILSCVLAFKFFDKFLEKKSFKNILYSLLFILIAVFSYQGTIAIFIALSSLVIIKYSKNIKDFIFNNIFMGICYSLPVITNFLTAKFLGTSRLNLEHNLLETITIISNQVLKVLLNSFNILPSGIFTLFIFITLIIVIVSIALQSKINFSKKMFLTFGLIYVIFMTYLFTVFPMFAQDPKTIAVFPRSTYTFGSIIGIIFAFSLINLNNQKNIENIITFISILLLFIQFICFNNIAINRFIVNYMDKYIIFEIEEKINNYENTTGTKIENISIYNLENAEKFYTSLNDSLNISARSEKMSCSHLLKYYLHRNFNFIEPDENIYNNYFKNKNWTLFNLDQIVIKGNTLHWYIY